MLRTSLLLGPALLPSIAFAQTPVPHILVGEGDVFPFGLEVDRTLDMDIADDGTWAALLVSTGGDRFVVKDGALAFREGGLSLGETIDTIHSIDVDDAGTVGMHYSVPDASNPGSTIEKIRIGSSVVVTEGDDVSLGTIGLTGTLQSIYEFDFEGTEMLLSCLTERPSGAVRQALLVGSNAPGTFTPVGGFQRPNPIPGATGTFAITNGPVDLRSEGDFAAVIETGNVVSELFVAVDTGVAVAETGAPGFAPNSTWTFGDPPRYAVNNDGHDALAGELELSNGAVRGAIYKDGVIVMIENQLLGFGVGVVDDFASTEIAIGDDGDVLYVLPLTGGEDVLMENAHVLLKTGRDTADGLEITGLRGSILGPDLALSEDGSLLLLNGSVDTIGNAILLVERDLSAPTTCATVPNSTGDVGELEAFGSRIVTLNELSLGASHLPAQQFSLLTCSIDEGFSANPGGSAGNLCLGGSIGRFNGQILAADALGNVTFDVDLSALPHPIVSQAAQPGETWYFQAWHREPASSGATSNFTQAIAVEML